MAETSKIGSKASNNGNRKKNRALTTGKASTAAETEVAVMIESTAAPPQQQQTEQPQSSLQGNGSDTPSPPISNDDESNPQQGAQQHQQQLQQQQSSSQSRNVRSTETQPTTTSASAASAATTKIPPTIKDYRKIFVGGLPSDVKPEEFLQCFEQYGTVIDSVIMYDRITTRSRGFGFITFEDPQICRQLIQMKRIPMRTDKFVEIKEAQPRETTATHPNLTYMLHNKYRRGGDVGAMPSDAFIPGMNHLMIGEPSMMDPSYMSARYGQFSDMPPSSPSAGRGHIDFSTYPGADTLAGSSQLYASNVHYSNNTLFVPENNATTSDEGQSNNMFLQNSPMSPSHVYMPYGEPYVPIYGMDNSYPSSTMPNGTPDEHSSNQRPPHLYPISMPYYNNQYIPPPPEMTNNLDSPQRINHPYDRTGMMHMSPTRSFYMASSYVPTTSFEPPFVDEAKLERTSPPQFFSSLDDVDTSKLNSTVEQKQHLNGESASTIKTASSVNDNPESNCDQQTKHNQETKE